MCVGCLAQCPPSHSWLVNHAHDSDGMSALSSETGIDTEVCKGGKTSWVGKGQRKRFPGRKCPALSVNEWLGAGRWKG